MSNFLLSPTDSFFYLKVCSEVNEVLNELTDRQKDIFLKRFVYSMTLEEIGDVYSLTRERVRQIQCKIIKKLKLPARQLIIYKFIVLIQDIMLNLGRNVLSLNEFVALVGNREIATTSHYLFLNNSNDEIGFDETYGFYYNKKELNFNDFIQNTVESLGEIISFDIYNTQPKYIKEIIEIKYNKKQFGYLLKGLPKRVIILSLLDREFPSGYKFWSDEDFKKFKQKFEYIYGDSYSIDKREVQCAITNGGYIAIDKACYINSKFAAKIPEELVEEIIEYIINYGKKLPYRAVYDAFIEQLNSIGINNPYYFKCLIDKEVCSILSTSRDYIAASKCELEKDSILEYLRNSEKPVSIEKLRDEFPGVKDYVFYQKIYFSKDILLLSNNRFFCGKKLDISDEEKDEIYNLVVKSVSKNDLNVTSSRVLFPIFSIYFPNLIAKYKYVNDYISFFSLISFLFFDKFEFNRPLICPLGFGETNTIDVCLRHFKNKKIVSFNEINSYLNTMGSGVANRIWFIEAFSKSGYLYDGINNFYLADKFNLSDINLIKKFLLNAIQLLKEVSIYGEQNLKIAQHLDGITWNKYAMYSFVVCYLYCDVEIIIKNENYEPFSFILRRNLDE